MAARDVTRGSAMPNSPGVPPDANAVNIESVPSVSHQGHLPTHGIFLQGVPVSSPPGHLGVHSDSAPTTFVPNVMHQQCSPIFGSYFSSGQSVHHPGYAGPSGTTGHIRPKEDNNQRRPFVKNPFCGLRQQRSRYCGELVNLVSANPVLSRGGKVSLDSECDLAHPQYSISTVNFHKTQSRTNGSVESGLDHPKRSNVHRAKPRLNERKQFGSTKDGFSDRFDPIRNRWRNDAIHVVGDGSQSTGHRHGHSHLYRKHERMVKPGQVVVEPSLGAKQRGKRGGATRNFGKDKFRRHHNIENIHGPNQRNDANAIKLDKLINTSAQATKDLRNAKRVRF